MAWSHPEVLKRPKLVQKCPKMYCKQSKSKPEKVTDPVTNRHSVWALRISQAVGCIASSEKD